MKVWNLQCFFRWSLRGSYENYDNSELSRNIKGLAASLMDDCDSRHAVRYDHMGFPSYKEVLKIILVECQVLTANKCQAASLSGNRWRVQKALVLALQVLVPPLRGRPYWDLLVVDNGEQSMIPLLIKNIYIFFRLPGRRQRWLSTVSEAAQNG